MESGKWLLLLWVILSIWVYYLLETGQSIQNDNENIPIINQTVKNTTNVIVKPPKNETKPVVNQTKPVVEQKNNTIPVINETISIPSNTTNETNQTETELENVTEQDPDPETYKCVKVGEYNSAYSKVIANKIYTINQQKGFIVIQMQDCVICLNPNLKIEDWQTYLDGMGVKLGYSITQDFCKLLA